MQHVGKRQPRLQSSGSAISCMAAILVLLGVIAAPKYNQPRDGLLLLPLS